MFNMISIRYRQFFLNDSISILFGNTYFCFLIQRFARSDKRCKLPNWIQAQLSDANVNLSIEEAAQGCRRFLRLMGSQPFRREDQLGLALLTHQDVEAMVKERAENAVIQKYTSGTLLKGNPGGGLATGIAVPGSQMPTRLATGMMPPPSSSMNMKM